MHAGNAGRQTARITDVRESIAVPAAAQCRAAAGGKFVRASLLLVAFCMLLPAATLKLYLKDGSYQLAREYKVEGDRVKYMSADRDEWEEIPVSLVDLEKTQAVIKQREAASREEAKSIKEEEQALKAAAKEVQRIPAAEGVYMVNGDKLDTVKPGE